MTKGCEVNETVRLCSDCHAPMFHKNDTVNTASQERKKKTKKKNTAWTFQGRTGYVVLL